MAEEITIHLRYNLETGKKDIYVDFTSEDDALPIEHEQQHRELMAQLLGQGVLHPDEVGDIKVRRLSPQAAPTPQDAQPIDAQQAAKQS
ncbi:MAG: hypothetical protein H6728_05975 [Myxococcales bacterium]|nr:hypothetical protein [Myxococcales bacterium]